MLAKTGTSPGLRRWWPGMWAGAAAVVPLLVLAAAGHGQAALLGSQQAGGPGAHITYSYTVTNDSGRPVTLPVIVDSRLGIISCRTRLLRPGRSTTCGPRTLTTTGAQKTRGTITSSVYARGLGGVRTGTVKVTVRAAVTVSVRVTVTVTSGPAPAPAPALVIAKMAVPDTFTGAGEPITYTYTVTNTGDATLHGVHVADSSKLTVDCPETTLPPEPARGATMTCTARHAIDEADLDAGHITNIAEVTGTTSTGVKATATSTPVTVTLAVCRVINTSSGHGYPGLQQAVDAAEPGAGLTVAGTCPGTTVVGKNLTITGRTGAILTGDQAGSVLTITDGASVRLDTLTITKGDAPSGGGIANNAGTVTLNDSTVTGNNAEDNGGGIYNGPAGTVTLHDGSTVSGNHAGYYGGGIDNFGTVIMQDGSTVSGNHAGYYGGGIYNYEAAVTLTGDSTVTGNTAGLYGGGIVNDFGTVDMHDTSTIGPDNTARNGGGMFNDTGTVTMTGDSKVTGNTAYGPEILGGVGGGIWSLFGTLNGAMADVNVLGNTPDQIFNY